MYVCVFFLSVRAGLWDWMGWDVCLCVFVSWICVLSVLLATLLCACACNAGDINIQNPTARTVRSPVPSQSYRTELSSLREERKERERKEEKKKKRRGNVFVVCARQQRNLCSKAT